MRLSRSVIVLLVVVVVLGTAAVYLAFNPDFAQRLKNMTRSTETIDSEEAIAQTAVAYAAPPFVDDYGLMRLSGYVQNMSQSDIRTAKIAIQLFDEDGNKKELVEHTVTDIDAGERKPYDVNAGSIAGSREATISIEGIEVYK